MLLVAKFSLFDEEYTEIRDKWLNLDDCNRSTIYEVLSIYRFRPNLR